MPALSRNVRGAFLLLFACALPACHSGPPVTAEQAASTAEWNKMSEAQQQSMYFTISGFAYLHPTGSPKREPQYEKAIAYFRAALIVQPDYHNASFDLADALIQTGKVDEGTTMLQTLTRYKDDPARWAQKRLAKMQRGAAK